MYDRILTGPVVPEEGRKRGRRPKHLAAAMQVNSLLASGMLNVGSLQSFQKNLQLTGLVSYPPSLEGKEPGSCLPGEGSRADAGGGGRAAACSDRVDVVPSTPPQPTASTGLSLNSLVLSNVYGGMFLPPAFGVGLPQLPLPGLAHPGKSQEARSMPYGLAEREVDDSLSQ
eukprot:g17944.t1